MQKKVKAEILGSMERDCSICKASNVTILHFRDAKDNQYQCCRKCFNMKFYEVDNKTKSVFEKELNRNVSKKKKLFSEFKEFNKWFNENMGYADADAKRLLKMGWYARAKLENKK